MDQYAAAEQNGEAPVHGKLWSETRLLKLLAHTLYLIRFDHGSFVLQRYKCIVFSLM
jgi:hypothetical protein